MGPAPARAANGRLGHMEERLPADPAKLASTLRDWRAGDTLPGRAMADLKHGGLAVLLPSLAADHPVLADPAKTWSQWERAKAGPVAVLEALWAADIVDILGELARA